MIDDEAFRRHDALVGVLAVHRAHCAPFPVSRLDGFEYAISTVPTIGALFGSPHGLRSTWVLAIHTGAVSYAPSGSGVDYDRVVLNVSRDRGKQMIRQACLDDKQVSDVLGAVDLWLCSA